VWSLFLPLDCNCSYGVVSVSTIGFVTVLTVWSLFLPLGCNCSPKEQLQTELHKQRPHRKNSYKPNGRNRDHTVRTVTNTMVETETFYDWDVTVLTVWSLFLPLGCNCSYGVISDGRNRDHTVRTVTNPMVETETTPQEQLHTQW
jgi:hypothetical protein